MSSFRLASRYSKSLLQLAQERNALETVYTEVLGIHALTSGSKELRLLLKSPIITPDKKLAVLKKLFDGKVSELTYKFLELLVKKGRESYIPEITSAFIDQYKTLKKITTVTLTSATKLDSATVDNIVNALKAQAGITSVDLKEVIDENLIGGFVLQYGDKQIDASIQRSLQQLSSAVIDDSFVKKF
jgi:F-type H+-transporting ATPase subunit delta